MNESALRILVIVIFIVLGVVIGQLILPGAAGIIAGIGIAFALSASTLFILFRKPVQ